MAAPTRNLAPLTRSARARMGQDIDSIEAAGDGVLADVLRRLWEEQQRTEALLFENRSLTERVEWLEGVVEGLVCRIQALEEAGTPPLRAA